MPACRSRTAAAPRRCARARRREPEMRTARPRVRRAARRSVARRTIRRVGTVVGWAALAAPFFCLGPACCLALLGCFARAFLCASDVSRPCSRASFACSCCLCLCRRRRFRACRTGCRCAGRRRFRGLARRQGNSANDFVGQLGIRVHDDLHRHVEIVTLRLRLLPAQQRSCRRTSTAAANARERDGTRA